MKKFKLFSTILGAVFLAFLIIIKLSEKPEDILQKHLKNKYKEEFVIAMLGKREEIYEAIIYPKKYEGTPRENDSYYWGKGFVRGKKGADTYGLVLLNESTNEFYLPKLKELFGNNVLPIFNLGPAYTKNNFKEEIEIMKKSYKSDPTGNFEPISGGIYIFGRVESDEDREWYRKQIYEFVQFMKETGTFEYVDLDILVVDSRELISTPRKLLENLPKNLSVEEWRKQRRVLMKAGNKEFNNMTQEELSEKINSINKSEYLKEFYGGLLGIKVYSPKYIKSQGLDNREVREYNSITDVRFDWEMW
ncbi:hypothetical protein [uncultured Fusobacterium sp.]|uniref:hypothetical protein n=1 Tax=uncultured Fusobacterium sp. TaxID=159267 RepID=UPI002613EBED|nr:hypothetical protein [uncultured Fusobacterium sp.]